MAMSNDEFQREMVRIQEAARAGQDVSGDVDRINTGMGNPPPGPSAGGGGDTGGGGSGGTGGGGGVGGGGVGGGSVPGAGGGGTGGGGTPFDGSGTARDIANRARQTDLNKLDNTVANVRWQDPTTGQTQLVTAQQAAALDWAKEDGFAPGNAGYAAMTRAFTAPGAPRAGQAGAAGATAPGQGPGQASAVSQDPKAQRPPAAGGGTSKQLPPHLEKFRTGPNSYNWTGATDQDLRDFFISLGHTPESAAKAAQDLRNNMTGSTGTRAPVTSGSGKTPSQIMKEFLDSDPRLALNAALNRIRASGASPVFMSWFQRNFDRFWGEYMGYLGAQAEAGQIPTGSFFEFLKGLDLDLFFAADPSRSQSAAGAVGSSQRAADYIQSGGIR